MNDKRYYIIATLDSEGANAIFNIQKELGIERDTFNDDPHVTLHAYDKEINAADLLEWIKEIAQTQTSVEICFHSLAVTKQQFAAVPSFTEDLYEMRCNIRQKYDEYSMDYFKKFWVPHVTIAYNGEEIINEKMSVVLDLFDNIKQNTCFRLNSIWVSCLENGNLTVLGKFPLQN
jgi:2'-5' RNA ligase